MSVLVALVIWAVALLMAIPFFTQTWWLPEPITDHGAAVDEQFMLTLVCTGVIFLLAQLALGYAVFKFGRKREGPASSIHGNDRWEVFWTTGAAALFIGLTLMGYSAWAEVRFIDAKGLEASPDRTVVEVTGQQFVWNMRYPGADGVFGPLDINMIDDSIGNPVGVDRNHPDGADDILVPRMAVPVNKEVEVVLRSKDVIHNFSVRELRIKLDTVPGIIGRLRFTPTKTGTYEIPCSELCGLGHYKMRSYLDVMEEADYQAWLQEQASFL